MHLPPPDYWYTSRLRVLVYLFDVSGKSRSPTRNRVSAFLRSPLRRGCVFIPISSLNPPYISKRSPLSTYFLALVSPSFLFFLFLSCTPRNSLWTASIPALPFVTFSHTALPAVAGNLFFVVLHGRTEHLIPILAAVICTVSTC